MPPPNFLIPAGIVIKNAKTYVEKLFSWDIWPEAGSANYLTGLPVNQNTPRPALPRQERLFVKHSDKESLGESSYRLITGRQKSLW